MCSDIDQEGVLASKIDQEESVCDDIIWWEQVRIVQIKRVFYRCNCWVLVDQEGVLVYKRDEEIVLPL